MATKQELMKPVEAPKRPGDKSFTEAMGISEPFLKKQSQIQTGITAAEGDILRGQQTQKETQAAGEDVAQKNYAAAEKGAMQQYGQKLEAEPLPAFIPTKDTAQDIAGLFSLIGVIGMIAGRGDARNAMGAMNGMLEGHRKGRADLYKQQALEFDKSFKAMMQKHVEFRKDMEDAIKLAATDKEAGMTAAKLAAVRAGSNIINAQIDRGDLVGAYTNVKDSQKAYEHANTEYNKQKQHAEDMAARERQHRETMAAKTAGKPLKEKELTKIEGMDSLSNSLEKLKKDFKPEYASLGVLGFGADLSLEAKRRLGDEKGRDAVSWWSRYQQLQAPNRHALFGATLTGNELKNYQSFTAKPGDAANTVRDFLQDQINYTMDTAAGTRRSFEAAGYKVPEGKPVDFESTYKGSGAAPVQNAQQDAVSRFGAYEPDKYDYGYEDGKFYRESK